MNKVVKIGLIAVGAVAAIAIVGGAMSGTDPGTDGQAQTAATQQGTTATQTSTSSIGQAATDGQFEFVVKSLTKDDNGRIGDQHAHGDFWTVTYIVKNVGDDPQTMFVQNQKLLIGKKSYNTSDKAIFLGDRWNGVEELGPDQDTQGFLLYDLPKGKQPTTLELHDSAFSGGVVVSLR